MSFGEEIKRLRLAHDPKLTQVSLAESLGVVQGYISDLESGRKSDVSTATLYKLSDALGVSVDHWRPFLTAETEPSAKPKPRLKPKN